MLELMVALAIVGAVSSLGFWRFYTQDQRMTVQRTARAFRVRMERARTLAAGLGGFLGNPSLFKNCVNLGSSGPQLQVVVDPGAGTYTVPVEVHFNAGVMESECAVVNVPVASRGRAELVTTPASPLTFAFTSTGWLDPDVTPGPVHVLFRRIDESGTAPEPGLGYGFRILPSGVICQASRAGSGCDED